MKQMLDTLNISDIISKCDCLWENRSYRQFKSIEKPASILNIQCVVAGQWW